MFHRLFATTLGLILITLLASCGDSRVHAPPPPTSAPTAVVVADADGSTSPDDPATLPGDAERGKGLFHGEIAHENDAFVACNTCHYVEENQGVLVGPNMAGLADRAGERIPGTPATEYLHNSIAVHDDYIVEGFDEGVMLSIVGDDFINILEPEDFDDLVAYLMTLTADAEGDNEAGGAAVAAAEETPTLAAGDDLPVDASGMIAADAGYQFQPPEGWHTGEFTVTIVTRPPEASYTSGPVITMRQDLIENLNIPNEKPTKITSTVELLDLLLTNFEEETGLISLEEVQDTEIGGAPARVARFQGRGFGDLDVDDVAGRVAFAVVDEEEVFVMLGLATPPENWTIDDAFDTMLASITFDDGGQPTSQRPTGEAAIGDIAIQPHFHDVHPYHVEPVISREIAIPEAVLLNANEEEDAEDAETGERDRDKGPRFACVHCHITHDIEMLHDSNPSCNTCHNGTPYQRHCVDCHSIHSVVIPHEINNPGCETCHAQGIPNPGVNVQSTLVTFMAYLFHEI